MSPENNNQLNRPVVREEQPKPVEKPEKSGFFKRILSFGRAKERITDAQKERFENDHQVNMMNAKLYEKLSGAGKGFVEKAYEGLQENSMTRKVVGKLEIAYNNFFVEYHGGDDTAKLADRVKILDIQIETSRKALSSMESSIASLAKSNMPTGGISEKLKEIQDRILNLEGKKDKLHSKVEYRQDKVNLYTQKRDAIADRLINRYEISLAPLESKLNALDEEKKKAAFLVEKYQVDTGISVKEFEKVENEATEIERNMVIAGSSEREAQKAVQILRDTVAEGRRKIAEGYEALAQEKIKLDEQIAKIKEDARPYRDARNEFIRVKRSRPVDHLAKKELRPEEPEAREESQTRSPRAESLRAAIEVENEVAKVREVMEAITSQQLMDKIPEGPVFSSLGEMFETVISPNFQGLKPGETAESRTDELLASKKYQPKPLTEREKVEKRKAELISIEATVSKILTKFPGTKDLIIKAVDPKLSLDELWLLRQNFNDRFFPKSAKQAGENYGKTRLLDNSERTVSIIRYDNGAKLEVINKNGKGKPQAEQEKRVQNKSEKKVIEPKVGDLAMWVYGNKDAWNEPRVIKEIVIDDNGEKKAKFENDNGSYSLDQLKRRVISKRSQSEKPTESKSQTQGIENAGVEVGSAKKQQIVVESVKGKPKETKSAPKEEAKTTPIEETKPDKPATAQETKKQSLEDAIKKFRGANEIVNQLKNSQELKIEEVWKILSDFRNKYNNGGKLGKLIGGEEIVNNERFTISLEIFQNGLGLDFYDKTAPKKPEAEEQKPKVESNIEKTSKDLFIELLKNKPEAAKIISDLKDPNFPQEKLWINRDRFKDLMYPGARNAGKEILPVISLLDDEKRKVEVLVYENGARLNIIDKTIIEKKRQPVEKTKERTVRFGNKLESVLGELLKDQKAVELIQKLSKVKEDKEAYSLRDQFNNLYRKGMGERSIATAKISEFSGDKDEKIILLKKNENGSFSVELKTKEELFLIKDILKKNPGFERKINVLIDDLASEETTLAEKFDKRDVFNKKNGGDEKIWSENNGNLKVVELPLDNDGRLIRLWRKKGTDFLRLEITGSIARKRVETEIKIERAFSRETFDKNPEMEKAYNEFIKTTENPKIKVEDLANSIKAFNKKFYDPAFAKLDLAKQKEKPLEEMLKVVKGRAIKFQRISGTNAVKIVMEKVKEEKIEIETGDEKEALRQAKARAKQAESMSVKPVEGLVSKSDLKKEKERSEKVKMNLNTLLKDWNNVIIKHANNGDFEKNISPKIDLPNFIKFSGFPKDTKYSAEFLFPVIKKYYESKGLSFENIEKVIKVVNNKFS